MQRVASRKDGQRREQDVHTFITRLSSEDSSLVGTFRNVCLLEIGILDAGQLSIMHLVTVTKLRSWFSVCCLSENF